MHHDVYVKSLFHFLFSSFPCSLCQSSPTRSSVHPSSDKFRKLCLEGGPDKERVQSCEHWVRFDFEFIFHLSELSVPEWRPVILSGVALAGDAACRRRSTEWPIWLNAKVALTQCHARCQSMCCCCWCYAVVSLTKWNIYCSVPISWLEIRCLSIWIWIWREDKDWRVR